MVASFFPYQVPFARRRLRTLGEFRCGGHLLPFGDAAGTACALGPAPRRKLTWKTQSRWRFGSDDFALPNGWFLDSSPSFSGIFCGGLAFANRRNRFLRMVETLFSGKRLECNFPNKFSHLLQPVS